MKKEKAIKVKGVIPILSFIGYRGQGMGLSCGVYALIKGSQPPLSRIKRPDLDLRAS